MPCPALRCCVVLRCAFFRTYSSTRYERSTRYQVLVYACCVLVFLLLQLISPVPMSPPPTQVTPALTPPTSTQHSTGQLALRTQLLALSIRCSHQNHGPIFSAPFTCYKCILPCVSAAGGISRPRSGALVDILVLATQANAYYSRCSSSGPI